MPRNTIIFVVRGMSLKSVFRVGIARRPVAFGQDCKPVIAHDEIEPLFLANVLRAKAPDVLGIVDEASHGTGRLQTDALKQLEVPLPCLAEQRAIARILGALDDKIELNRRMNATLEAMARALFKSWFVDFDPVHTKLALSGAEGAEGRDTGLPAEIAGLFPDGFEESAVGEAPAFGGRFFMAAPPDRVPVQLVSVKVAPATVPVKVVVAGEVLGVRWPRPRARGDPSGGGGYDAQVCGQARPAGRAGLGRQGWSGIRARCQH